MPRCAVPCNAGRPPPNCSRGIVSCIQFHSNASRGGRAVLGRTWREKGTGPLGDPFPAWSDLPRIWATAHALQRARRMAHGRGEGANGPTAKVPTHLRCSGQVTIRHSRGFRLQRIPALGKLAEPGLESEQSVRTLLSRGRLPFARNGGGVAAAVSTIDKVCPHHTTHARESSDSTRHRAGHRRSRRFQRAM